MAQNKTGIGKKNESLFIHKIHHPIIPTPIKKEEINPTRFNSIIPVK